MNLNRDKKRKIKKIVDERNEKLTHLVGILVN